MATTTEFTVRLENRPGTLADLMETLGNAGVNVEGMMGDAGQGKVQFVTNDPPRAEQALRAATIQYQTHQVLMLMVANVPGAGARVGRAFANAGINVESTYSTLDGRVVIGVDNLASAEAVARELGVW